MSATEPGQHILLVQNNNIIERVVQTSIGKGHSTQYAYRSHEPQQIEYGMQEEHLQLQEDSDGGGSTSSGAGGVDRGVYTEEEHQDHLHHLQTSGKSSSGGGGGGAQKRGGMVVDDKKMRRQIANSNERRRMQSINAGFQSLRNQLPHHEGEKLSKAAILQQTSEYIYSLEQERTQLLSQNCHLKRLLGQHDIAQDLQQSEVLTVIGGSGGGSPAAGSAVALVPTSATILVPGSATTTTTTSSASAPKNGGAGGKKRKMDPVTTIQTTVSDSSDEGLGSMSPEPFTIVLNSSSTGKTKKQQAAAIAAAELKQQQQTQQAVAELERSQRATEGYAEVIHGSPVVTEIVEPCLDFEIDIDSAPIEETVVSSERSVPVVSAAPLPKKKRITVESLEAADAIEGATRVAVVNGKIAKIFRDPSDMHSGSHEIQELQVLNCDSELVLCSPFAGDAGIGAYETSSTTEAKPLIVGKLGKAKVAIIEGVKSKLQPLLESFNKVENKVEVERITNSPVTMAVVKEEPGTAGARAFLNTSTSRQNLETIVEAIRHLEGESFGEQPKNGRNGVVVKTEALQSLVADLPTQEVPLALTTKASKEVAQRELSQFVHFKTKAVAEAKGSAAAVVAGGATSSSGSAMPKLTTTTATTLTLNGQPTTVVLHQLQQCRPGVIVSKQSS